MKQLRMFAMVNEKNEELSNKNKIWTLFNFVDSINEIAFTNDSKYLAVACDRQIKIFYSIWFIIFFTKLKKNLKKIQNKKI